LGREGTAYTVMLSSSW